VLLSGSKGASGNTQFRSRNALVLIVALGAAALTLLPAAVAGAAPPSVVASFSYSPALPLANQTVVFNSTSTASGSNNQIATQAWDLDNDGQFDDAEGPTAFRAFANAGSYSVSLLVIDTHGGQATAVKTVTVNSLPSASFAYSSSPVAGDPVYFFSTSSDADGFIKSQAWDLDNDGQFDDGTNTLVTRTFGTPGR
jgi:PKD repeat protein